MQAYLSTHYAGLVGKVLQFQHQDVMYNLAENSSIGTSVDCVWQSGASLYQTSP